MVFLIYIIILGVTKVTVEVVVEILMKVHMVREFVAGRDTIALFVGVVLNTGIILIIVGCVGGLFNITYMVMVIVGHHIFTRLIAAVKPQGTVAHVLIGFVKYAVYICQGPMITPVATKQAVVLPAVIVQVAGGGTVPGVTRY